MRSLRSVTGRGGRDIVWCLVLLVVVSSGFLLFQDNFVGTSLTLAVPYAIVVVGMVLQIGYGRQLALGQVVFMALGAYGVGILNVKMGLPVAVAILVVVAASFVVSLAVGAVVARVGGLALGLVTFFLVVMLSDSIIYSSYLGGTTGIGPVAALVPAASAGASQIESDVVAAAILAAATLVVVRILRDDVGAEISLLGASSRAAASVGIRGPRRRVEIFILGSVLATVGGALFAALQGFVSPTEFDASTELTLLLMLFLGGQASVYCAVVGPFLIEAMAGIGSAVANNITLIQGGLFTVLLTAFPMGIGGLGQNLAARFTSRTLPSDDRMSHLRHLGLSLAWISDARKGTGSHRTPRLAAAQITGDDNISERLSSRADAPSVAIHSAGGDSGFRAVVGALREREREEAASSVGSSEAGGSATTPAVRVRGVTKRFGGVVAVNDVTFDIAGPGVTCIVGPNGAGKSTLLELLSGEQVPDSGSVEFQGRDVTQMPSWQRARMGMSRTFQNVQLCETLSPLDNVAVAAIPVRRSLLCPVLRGTMEEARRHALQTMELLDIAEVADFGAHRLTLAQERNVELSRALVRGPKLVLLDEPASGLSEQQRTRFADLIGRVGQRLPVVLVEHDLRLVSYLAKIVIVLVEGAVLYHGGVEGFEQDPAVAHHLRGVTV